MLKKRMKEIQTRMAEIEKELDNYISSIEQLLLQEKPPECIQTSTCKKCAYYEYCYI